MKSQRSAIDWCSVRARLLETQTALEKALVPDPERVKAVYRERAARLAARFGPAAGSAAMVEVLVVRVAEERFAIEIGEVVEVMGSTVCAPVPGAPSSLAGVANARGAIRPVWDSHRLFGLAPARSGGILVLLRRAGAVAGLQVDEVEGIRKLNPRDWTQPAERPHHVKAITADLLPVLDLQKLLLKEST